jgi:hypothetical protein
VNAKGAFWFCTYEGALNAELFVDLLAADDALAQEVGSSGAR